MGNFIFCPEPPLPARYLRGPRCSRMSQARGAQSGCTACSSRAAAAPVPVLVPVLVLVLVPVLVLEAAEDGGAWGRLGAGRGADGRLGRVRVQREVCRKERHYLIRGSSPLVASCTQRFLGPSLPHFV